MDEHRKMQRRINILKQQREVFERRSRDTSCQNHVFDESWNFKTFFEDITIFFTTTIYPRLTADRIGFWRNVIKGRQDFCFPNDCTSYWDQICFIVGFGILENNCKRCLYDKVHIMHEKFSLFDIKNLITESLKKIEESDPQPNSKQDIMQCVLSGFASVIDDLMTSET